ncbi:MAG: endonuclease/exonuclease/phosphatase family protein [Muribaculaceae bacterium]|nr:endonuclease/exonuclease/phosphatase family protein [Muribaculaceae bacterium]
MPVNIWTVNSEGDIRYSIEQGVDFITTNDPELAQKLIEEAYATLTLRIMSYNLRFGELATMERLASEIKAFNPDFVALQEVDINTMRKMAPHNNGVNFINELAAKTGMFGYFGKTINFSVPGGYYGVGILSRYPADQLNTIPLPNPKNEEPRIILIGTFRMEEELPFIFASTHFDYKSEDTQSLQAQCVVNRFADTPIPAIIAGDFNCTLNSAPIETMKSCFELLSGTAPTFPAKEPISRLDYIWGTPKADFKLIETSEGSSGQDTASDHLPVMSVIEFSR